MPAAFCVEFKARTEAYSVPSAAAPLSRGPKNARTHTHAARRCAAGRFVYDAVNSSHSKRVKPSDGHANVHLTYPCTGVGGDDRVGEQRRFRPSPARQTVAERVDVKTLSARRLFLDFRRGPDASAARSSNDLFYSSPSLPTRRFGVFTRGPRTVGHRAGERRFTTTDEQKKRFSKTTAADPPGRQASASVKPRRWRTKTTKTFDCEIKDDTFVGFLL